MRLACQKAILLGEDEEDEANVHVRISEIFT
jgi:hypothetical protein